MTLHQFYLNSKEVKRLIVERSLALQLPLRYICHEIEYDYRLFMESYVNSVNNDNCKLTEEQFEKILELLGVTVRYQLVVDKAFDADGERNRMRENYDNRKKKNGN